MHYSSTLSYHESRPKLILAKYGGDPIWTSSLQVIGQPPLALLYSVTQLQENFDKRDNL
jgi:hypothetical protein